MNDVPTKVCPECGLTGNHRKNRSLYCKDCYDARYCTTSCPNCGGRMRLRSEMCARCKWGDPHPAQITPEQAAWLAGLLEGEGSFVSGKSIAIQVTMTDLDIIQRLPAITGVGRIYRARVQKAHYKDAWLWSVQRRAHIRHVINTVLPWLGERRSAAALKLLDRVANARDRSWVAPTAAKNNRSGGGIRTRASLGYEPSAFPNLATPQQPHRGSNPVPGSENPGS